MGYVYTNGACNPAEGSTALATPLPNPPLFGRIRNWPDRGQEDRESEGRDRARVARCRPPDSDMSEIKVETGAVRSVQDRRPSRPSTRALGALAQGEAAESFTLSGVS